MRKGTITSTSTSTSTSTDRFYRTLPATARFEEAFLDDRYRPVPDDWIVAATDVVNSTVAIEEGRYKDVTIAGALGTIAIANHLKTLEFPYFFGGDGMFFLLPGSLQSPVLALLADTRRVVRELSGLDLRAGVIPVRALYGRGATLEIARVQVTPRYFQAAARGTGLDLADTFLKHGGGTGEMILIGESPSEAATDGAAADATVAADFRGFSCRWQDIPSTRGETMSLIVRDRDESLRNVYTRIMSHLGDADAAHPLAVASQTSRARGTGARSEAIVLSPGGFLRHLVYPFQRLRIGIEVLLVRFLIFSGVPIRIHGKKLANVRTENIQNADIRKRDGMLKMVVSVTPEERRRILDDLDALYRLGRVYYGYHISDRAIMTCLIHTNHSDEVHFVDAADGGYARAAKMLKSQIAGEA